MKPDTLKETATVLIRELTETQNKLPAGITIDENKTLSDADRAIEVAIEKLQWFIRLRDGPLGSKG